MPTCVWPPSLSFLPAGCSHFLSNSCWTFTHYPSLHYIKQLALFSQYGEVRKVEPPAVGPKESVRYGWGRFSPRYSANGWARDAAVCRIHWTAASVMFQSLAITLFVDVSPTRSVTGRPSCLSRNGTSLVHASTRLLNRQVFRSWVTTSVLESVQIHFAFICIVLSFYKTCVLVSPDRVISWRVV